MFGVKFLNAVASFLMLAVLANGAIIDQKQVKGASYRVYLEDGVTLPDSAEVAQGTTVYVDVDVQRNDDGIFYLDAAYSAVNAYGTPGYYINGQMKKIEAGKRYSFVMSEWNVRVNLSVFRLYSIKYTVDGNGSVSIKNTVKDNYNGDDYYISGNTVFLVNADDGYYMSSAAIRNWPNKKVISSVNQSNEIFQFSIDGQGMDYIVDVVFKPIDESITNSIDKHCEAVDLPTSAKPGASMNFTILCEDGYSVQRLHISCAEKDPTCGDNNVSKDSKGVYTLFKSNAATTVTSDVYYKMFFVDEGESYAQDFFSAGVKEYFYEGEPISITAKLAEDEIIKSIQYSYESDTGLVKDSLKFSSCSTTSDDCVRVPSFTMPGTPVTITVVRESTLSSSSVADENSSSSAVDESYSSSNVDESSSSCDSDENSSSSGVDESSSSEDDFGDLTGVEFSTLQDGLKYRVSVSGRSVMVDGFDANAFVAVFDMQGRVMVAQKMVPGFAVELPRSGRYLVKMGNVTKVVDVR